jgi:ElaB/YqjD/DUF883 family membrane-anchored ribosome-binding protein
MADHKPEGTDTIIEGAGVGADDERDLVTDDTASDTEASPRADATDTDGQAPIQSFTDRVDSLRGQANDRARDFVAGAKDRATGSLDDIVRLIEDAASEVDDKVGAQYGDYVRRASSGVSGLSEALKGKDVDALFADANELIRKSPGVAIGAAAAIGFVVARLARAGLGDVAASATPQGGKAA